MKYQNRWQKQRLNNGYITDDDNDTSNLDEYSEDDTNDLDFDKYNKDDPDIQYSGSPLKGVIIAGAIAAAGYGAYKAGLLRGIINRSIKIMSNHKNTTATHLSTFKNWLEKENDLDNSLKHGLNIKKAFKEDGYIHGVINDTKADLKKLYSLDTDAINKVKDTAEGIVGKNYDDTNLMYVLGQAKTALDDLKHKSILDTDEASNIMMNAILNSERLTKDEAAKQMKLTGTRPLTLGDVIKKTDDGNIEYLNSSKFKFNEEAYDKLKTEFLDKIITDEKGHSSTILNSNKFKDVILDKNILIDDKGDISDIRDFANSIKFHIDSLANDFQVPFIGINPLGLFDINKQSVKPAIALLNEESFQPFITGVAGRGENAKLKNAINGQVFVAYNKAYRFNVDHKAEQIADDIYLEDITKNLSTNGLPRSINIFRKIAGLNFRETIDKDTSTGFTNFYRKFMKTIDLGFQDAKFEPPFNILDPSTYMNYFYYKATNNKNSITGNFIKKFLNKLKPYDGEIRHQMKDVFGKSQGGHSYVAFRKSKKINDIVTGNTSVSDYLKQFITGRKDLKKVTKATTIPYFLFERMNESISSFGIGLGNDSLGSVGDVFKGLLLKRFLPVYLGINTVIYLDSLTDHTDKNGNRHSVSKDLATAGVRADVAMHGIADRTGITNLFKKLKQLTPGSDQIGELPGMSFLNFSQTKEERAAYWKAGMVPIRKGRYWSLGNTSFTGGKINYYVPNAYRRLISDYKYTSTLYGSKSEYFANAPFPTPTHPFAPIRHFITDRYHYDKKHYYDRPYLETSPAFQDVPIIGPVLSSTVGRIVKPVKRMHPEYWNGSVNDNNNSGTIYNNILPIINKIPGIGRVVANYNTNKQQASYETSSGNTQIINLNNISPANVNKLLKNKSINKIQGASMQNNLKNVPIGNISSQNGVSNTLANEYRQISDVAGIYGFTVSGYLTGIPGQDSTMVEQSGYMTSFNRTFWEKNIGGIGGDLSEIFRRFMPKRRKDVTFYNPVRNRMSNWLPGQDYFLDLQHGDPYSSHLENGEMRLPGEAYERLWGLDNVDELRIESIMIGTRPQDMLMHYLKKDTGVNYDIEVRDRKTTSTKHRIENAWLKTGIAIDIQGEVNDRRNKINAYYDARIHDNTSSTKESIVMIKALDDKTFRKLHHGNQRNIEQLNYLLYATGNKKGYLYYVNKDHNNPVANNNKNVKIYTVNYNKGMLKGSLDTLNSVRGYIKNQMASGNIKRGDLYDYFDRYRILADVAPWSQEFKDMNAIVSQMKLTDQQQAERSEIIKRIRAEKEPLRVYPYKFRTAKLRYANVHITKVIDANTYLTKEFPNNPIRLAGIHVSTDKTDQNAAIARNRLSKYLHVGSSVKIGVNIDTSNQIANDTLNTIHAVIYKNEKNINKYMIDNNLATEKQNDWTPTGVNARFTKAQIDFGRAWERIAHANTFLNTKLLQVRSAYEDYNRRNVYGRLVC